MQNSGSTCSTVMYVQCTVLYTEDYINHLFYCELFTSLRRRKTCLSEIEYIKENESLDAAQVGANRCVPRLNASSFQGLSTLGRVSFISKSVFLSFISPPSDNSMVGIYHDSLPPHFIFLSKLV